MRRAPPLLAAVAALMTTAAHAQWTMPTSTAAPAPPPAAPPPAAPPPAPPPYPPPAAPPPLPPAPTAGGLTAPPPLSPAAAPSADAEKQKRQDEAKEEDSGRGLSWFWIDAEGGFQHVGLQTFEVDEGALTAGLVESTASGGYIGAGLGLRLVFLTLGPRFRVGFFSPYQLFSIGGELGIRIPLGVVEPHFNLGAGYSALGSLSGAIGNVPDAVSISGLDVRVGGGLDFFVTNVLSLGIGASWELLVLTRPGVPLDNPQAACSGAATANDPNAAAQCAAQAEGSGFGSAISIGAKLGLHF
jgi:hypothetical protein